MNIFATAIIQQKMFGKLKGRTWSSWPPG